MFGAGELSHSCNLITNDDTPTTNENYSRISLLCLDKVDRLLDSSLDLYQSRSPEMRWYKSLGKIVGQNQVCCLYEVLAQRMQDCLDH